MNDEEKLVSKMMSMGATLIGKQLLKAAGDCPCKCCRAIREVFGKGA